MNLAKAEIEISRNIQANWQRDSHHWLGLSVCFVPFGAQTTLCINVAIALSSNLAAGLAAGQMLMPAVVGTVSSRRFINSFDWLQVYVIGKSPVGPKKKLLRLNLDRPRLRVLAEGGSFDWDSVCGLADVKVLIEEG